LIAYCYWFNQALEFASLSENSKDKLSFSYIRKALLRTMLVLGGLGVDIFS
jgi:hypothetical protein